jgi:cobalt-zinc-cadmium efflux system protein
VYKNLKKSLLIVLQGIPEDVDLNEIKQQLKNIHEVTDIHDCHAWSMDGNYHILTLHLQLDKDYRLSEQARLKKKIATLLKDESINHITIEFEGNNENCELKEC